MAELVASTAIDDLTAADEVVAGEQAGEPQFARSAATHRCSGPAEMPLAT